MTADTTVLDFFSFMLDHMAKEGCLTPEQDKILRPFLKAAGRKNRRVLFNDMLRLFHEIAGGVVLYPEGFVVDIKVRPLAPELAKAPLSPFRAPKDIQ